tara:strand:- start:44 stop:544 length:501 start_codon:yes stop_codon:yes gene_type:complete
MKSARERYAESEETYKQSGFTEHDLFQSGQEYLSYVRPLWEVAIEATNTVASSIKFYTQLYFDVYGPTLIDGWASRVGIFGKRADVVWPSSIYTGRSEGMGRNSQQSDARDWDIQEIRKILDTELPPVLATDGCDLYILQETLIQTLTALETLDQWLSEAWSTYKD